MGILGRKATSGIMLTLLVISMLTWAFVIQTVKAEPGTIYIRADGSVDPPTAPIHRDGDIYTLNGNIYSNYHGIVVLKDNIIVDGASFTVQGPGWTNVYPPLNGIDIMRRSDVTIKNIKVQGFYWGVLLWESSGNTISGNDIRDNHDGIYIWESSNNKISKNNIRNNGDGIRVFSSSANNMSGNNILENVDGIRLYPSSNHNTISENNLLDNGWCIWISGSSSNTISGNNVTHNMNGILLLESSLNNTISENTITNTGGNGIYLSSSLDNTISKNIITDSGWLLSPEGGYGITLYASSSNTISGNDIKNNRLGSIMLEFSSNNLFFHNNFVKRAGTSQVYTLSSLNVWDNGYPSGGNYWSDYIGVDEKSGPNQDQPSSDGIGDIPYIINENNHDHYPLMNYWEEEPPPPEPPVASFTWAPMTPEKGETITFDASSSTPNSETIIRYKWNFGDGKRTIGKKVTHSYASSGVYTVTLNVTNSKGLWDIEQKQIQVLPPSPPPKPPVARFTHKPLTPKVGEKVTFDASISYDPDGKIVSYKWNFGDGHTKAGKIVTHSYSNARNYNVKLTIKDNDGKSSSRTKTVTVVKPATNKNRLKILTKYYNIIAQSQGWTKSGSFYYLNYYPDGKKLPRSSKTISGFTTVDDGDIYPSECVDFVRVLSNTHKILTKKWRRGPKVMTCTNIEPGTVIATFSYDSNLGRFKYDYGHVAVFAGFRYSGGEKIGFRVFDQNWKKDGGLGVAGRHSIYKTGSTYVSDADNYYVVILKGITVKATCPVDLVVLDPDWLVTSKEFSEVPDTVYIEEDFNEDGFPDDYIFIPEQKIGEYLITVIPEPGADPTATYTLEVSTEDATLLLAENVPISDVPTEPYILDSTTFDTPPVTTLTIDEPKYIDPLNNTYVSSATPFNLTAEDNPDGSGVASTSYRIHNGAYDTDWLNYTEPFNLTGLIDGSYSIEYNSTDNAGNVEPSNTAVVVLDNTGPSITVLNPHPPGCALQDGVTFIASAIDSRSGVFSLNFSIREADGGEGISVGFDDLPATYNATTEEWSLSFDTLLLPDGYYVVLVNAADNLGNIDSIIVPYSIRNWAVVELLPASEDNKAARTMPVKFSLRVAASVDPLQPFVYNEELIISINATELNEILQESTFGDTNTDYRISNVLYITNFKTLRTSMEYEVTVYRDTFEVGSFTFETMK